jgi:hypothetical protein
MRNSTILLLGLLIAAGPGVVTAREYVAVEPYSQDFIVSGDTRVGNVLVWEEDGRLNVKYAAAGGWCLTETGLSIATADGEVVFESLHRCISDTTYRVPVTWDPETRVTLRAEVGVGESSMPGFYASYNFVDGQPRAEFLWPPEYGEGVIEDVGDCLPILVLVLPDFMPPGPDPTIYIAGSLQAISPAWPDWDPAGVQLVVDWRDSTRRVLCLPPGGTLTGVALEYKYTLGSWEGVEKAPDCGEMPNRGFTFVQGYETALDTLWNFTDYGFCAGDPAQVDVVLNVTVPPATPPESTVYVMGNFWYLDPGYPSWDPGGIPMTEVTSGEWTVTLTGAHAVAVAYRYTLGTFASQELGGDCNAISPRTLRSGYGTGLINDTVVNWGGVSPCEPFESDLNITVTVPAGTPADSTVYITGTLSHFDPGLPDWDAAGMAMTKVGPDEWHATLPGVPGILEYKYTLGSWSTVEKGPTCEETSNRSSPVTGYNDEINDTVQNWRNVPPCGD